MKLKILTLNMHKGFSPLLVRYTLNDLRLCLESVHPDIVFLQEITGQHPSRHSNQQPHETPLEVLADRLWPHSAYGKNAIYNKGGHHGNAILSKFPFSKWENIDISTNRLEKRGLLHGEILVSDDAPVIHLFCLHLNLLESGRRRQVRSITDRIFSHVEPGQRIILAGDFNDWRQQVDFNFHADLQLSDCFKELTGQHARTFPNFLPLLPLDRVYNRGFNVTSAEVLQSALWGTLSDHLPILTELEFIHDDNSSL